MGTGATKLVASQGMFIETANGQTFNAKTPERLVTEQTDELPFPIYIIARRHTVPSVAAESLIAISSYRISTTRLAGAIFALYRSMVDYHEDFQTVLS